MKIFHSLLLIFSLFFFACSSSAVETKAEEPVQIAQAKGKCPQPRKTPDAPAKYKGLSNPQPAEGGNLDAGKTLYQKTAKPFVCSTCHGADGSGMGDPDFESTPAARNFTCGKTMQSLSDGQLFWIIKNGSPNTSMPAHSNLTESDIWNLVLYIRKFSGN